MATQAPTAPLTASIPLRERRRDWYFIVMYSLFAITSFVTDPINTIGRPSADSGYPVERFMVNNGNESLVLANPRFVQITTGWVSAMLFGVFYLVLIYAFVRGRNWIRMPAVFYAGMVVMGTAVYLGVGVLGDAPLFQLACGGASAYDYKFPNPALSLAYNLPYPLTGLLLVARMWRERPFTR